MIITLMTSIWIQFTMNHDTKKCLPSNNFVVDILSTVSIFNMYVYIFKWGKSIGKGFKSPLMP